MGVIYKITNRVNGKVYIGKTAVLARRWRQHQHLAKRGSETYLYRAMRKYGLDSFSVEIIDQALLLEELAAKEIAHIKALKSNDQKYGYNCEMAETGGVLGHKGKKHSMETKQKMAESHRRFWEGQPERRIANGLKSKQNYAKNPWAPPTISPERRLIIAEKVRQWWADHPEQKKKHGELHRSRYAQEPWSMPVPHRVAAAEVERG